MNDSIVALATPPMKSALAIIRLSGDDAFDIVEKIFDKSIDKDHRKIYHGLIKDKKEIIDEVIINAYVAPNSFTGENLIEIITHGSMLIVEQVITLLISLGARMASRGEFTSRAYYHQKVDLIQAEAINDVINATSLESKNLSFKSLNGETSSLLTPIREILADLISNIEVNIDYPEYVDIEEVNNARIIKDSKDLIEQLDRLIKEGKQGKIIHDGVNVAIVGKPNVGKSSLLNAFLKENKAIVTDIAGTTRDVVEGEVIIDGIKLHLYDTAGIRDSLDQIEQIGINKAKEVIQNCDLVLLVLDASKSIDEEDQSLLDFTKDKKRIIVYNKSDIKNIDELSISALKGEITPLKEKIKEVLGIEDASFIRPSLYNSRQLALLIKAQEDIRLAYTSTLEGLSIDLVSVHLLDAFNSIKEILGEGDYQDLSKDIFARFCVGK